MAFMLFPWLTRRFFYILERPGFSAVSSLVYAIFVLFFLIICKSLAWLSPATGLIILATAGTVSSVFLVLSYPN